MCFIILPNHLHVKIAKRDIPCYKVLTITSWNKSLESPYYDEIYFANGDTHPVIKEVEEFGFNWNHIKIEEGLHSYSTYNKAKLAGRQFYKTIHKAIIPKGTEYYYNSIEKEYVSLKLKVWKKNIKIKK
jgi:hypothetical protein